MKVTKRTKVESGRTTVNYVSGPMFIKSPGCKIIENHTTINSPQPGKGTFCLVLRSEEKTP